MSTNEPGGPQPLLTFQIITDTHVTADPSHEYNLNFERALHDLAHHAQGSSGIMHIGDITDHGLLEEYEEVHRILQLHQAALPEIRYTLGNHDVGLGHWESRLAMYTSRMGMPGPYHDHWIGGYHFIFLGTEEGLPTFCKLSEEQLRWLDRKLGEKLVDGHSKPEQPVFLFLHQPLKDTVAGSLESQEWYGVTQDKELRSILSKYPQTLLLQAIHIGSLKWTTRCTPATARRQPCSIVLLLLTSGRMRMNTRPAAKGIMWKSIPTKSL